MLIQYSDPIQHRLFQQPILQQHCNIAFQQYCNNIADVTLLLQQV